MAKLGFASIVRGSETVGSMQVLTLDFEITLPDGRTTYVQQYYIIDGSLLYMLDFPTTRPDTMLALFRQMARSFTHRESAGA